MHPMHPIHRACAASVIFLLLAFIIRANFSLYSAENAG